MTTATMNAEETRSALHRAWMGERQKGRLRTLHAVLNGQPLDMPLGTSWKGVVDAAARLLVAYTNGRGDRQTLAQLLEVSAGPPPGHCPSNEAFIQTMASIELATFLEEVDPPPYLPTVPGRTWKQGQDDPEILSIKAEQARARAEAKAQEKEARAQARAEAKAAKIQKKAASGCAVSTEDMLRDAPKRRPGRPPMDPVLKAKMIADRRAARDKATAERKATRAEAKRIRLLAELRDLDGAPVPA